MSEVNKTTCFFVAALGAIALALLTRPSTEEYDVEELRGAQLVEDFPSDAPKRLRITTMNEETGDVDAFEVAEIDGLWRIPSKSGYPADATEQMAAAVDGVVGREILEVIDAGTGDHATYGVVDPSDTSADEGFGTHVQLTSGDDEVLADLIIGNEDKDEDGKYYVRKAKQDVVYTTRLDVDKFSTDFSNWIEKDLLGLSSFDVAEIEIDDYTIETELYLTRTGLAKGISGEDRRARMHLVYDDDQSKWQADSLKMYDQSKQAYEDFSLSENEELNADALRELKTALDDLEIVDVEKKPDGLSADLRAGADFMNNNEALTSLMRRGFLPVATDPKDPNSEITLLSSEGEIVVTLKDGVEYVLRFGDLQIDPSQQGSEAEADQEAEETATNDEGLNRYLFVMARFDESAIEKPELEELPELPAEEKSEESEESDGDAEEEATADESDGEGASSEESDDEAKNGGAESDKPEQSREEIEAERERIEESNKRAEEEYNEKIEAGKKRVDELNARFGDWYYVIANDVFKKVHLGRDEVIKQVESEDEEASSDATKPDESAFGAPGAAIPGLPSLGGGESDTSSEQPPTTDEAGTEQPSAEPATDTNPEGDSSAEPSTDESATDTESAEDAGDEQPDGGE